MIRGKFIEIRRGVAKKDAIVATRVWQLSPVGELTGTHRRSFVWQPGNNSAKLPNLNVKGKFWWLPGLFEKQRFALRQHGGGLYSHKSMRTSTNYAKPMRRHSTVVTGRVKVFGTVAVYSDGYRSTRAEIVSINLPRVFAHQKPMIQALYPSIKIRVV